MPKCEIVRGMVSVSVSTRFGMFCTAKMAVDPVMVVAVEAAGRSRSRESERLQLPTTSIWIEWVDVVGLLPLLHG